jgi:hypothetical protein
MYTQRPLACAAVLMSITAGLSMAQSVTSAHSGTLHYFDGAVTIDGVAVESKVGKFSEMKDNAVLRTGQGRAEILLTPGVFLRVGENTAVKMLDNRLLSTRVEFLSGSAIVESDDPEVSVKDHAVTIIYKDYEIQPLKYGVFEITSEPSQIKVYKGQANVVAGTNHTQLKEGRLLPFTAALLSEKLDEKQADDLYLWTRDRSAYLSTANMASARTLASHGYAADNLFLGGYPGLGFSSRFQGGWYYNPLMSMYTYMPYSGTFWSPFGYGFFSPVTISSFYSPAGYYWYGGGGSRTGGGGGVQISSPSTISASSISRLGVGGASHATAASPVRANTGFGAARGGFESMGGASEGRSFNGLNNAAPVNSLPSGGFGGGASSGGGFSAPAPAARAASGGGGGPAVAAPRGR